MTKLQRGQLPPLGISNLEFHSTFGFRASNFLTLLVLPLIVLLVGCSQPQLPPYSTTLPTTRISVPRSIVALSAPGDLSDTELNVEDAGPYRLYASNAPYHILGTARLQSGDLLRFHQLNEQTLQAQYVGELEHGSFLVPLQQGVEYFWAKTVWSPEP